MLWIFTRYERFFNKNSLTNRICLYMYITKHDKGQTKEAYRGAGLHIWQHGRRGQVVWELVSSFYNCETATKHVAWNSCEAIVKRSQMLAETELVGSRRVRAKGKCWFSLKTQSRWWWTMLWQKANIPSARGTSLITRAAYVAAKGYWNYYGRNAA